MATENADFFLDMELEQAQTGRDAAGAKIERLLRTAFENGERAVGSYNSLHEARGVEGVIRTLESDSFLGRRWYFGAMQGDFLVRGNREEAREALRQLPDAIRTHQTFSDLCHDLNQAKREAIERRDRQRLARDTIYAEHAPVRGRGRN